MIQDNSGEDSDIQSNAMAALDFLEAKDKGQAELASHNDQMQSIELNMFNNDTLHVLKLINSDGNLDEDHSLDLGQSYETSDISYQPRIMQVGDSAGFAGNSQNTNGIVDSGPQSDHIFSQVFSPGLSSGYQLSPYNDYHLYGQSSFESILVPDDQKFFYGQENLKLQIPEINPEMGFMFPPSMENNFGDGMSWQAVFVSSDFETHQLKYKTNQIPNADSDLILDQDWSLYLSQIALLQSDDSKLSNTLPRIPDIEQSEEKDLAPHTDQAQFGLVADGAANNTTMIGSETTQKLIDFRISSPLENQVTIANMTSQPPPAYTDKRQTVRTLDNSPIPTRASVISRKSSARPESAQYNNPLYYSPRPNREISQKKSINAGVFSKFQNRSHKCCYCFPRNRFGVSLCLFMTFFILSALALVGYFLFPRMPDFKPRLFRSDNFFQNGLNITTDPLNPSNFTAKLYLVMNVTVYNPNPYSLVINKLDLRASIQPNASALAGSGLSGTADLKKNSIIPATQVGFGETQKLIFPPRTETNFSFDIIIQLDTEDILINPYLRPELEQTCTSDPTQRAFMFTHVITLRNNFLEAFGYIPSFTSSSSVRCPLDETQTNRIRSLLPQW